MRRLFLIALLALALLAPAAAAPSQQATQPACTPGHHGAHATTGPDGAAYPTWHPQLHKSCAFDHEHGSNPDTFRPGWRVPFGYAAGRAGTTEPHPGFKQFTILHDGKAWLVTAHMGTSGAGRLCTRFHSLSIAVRDAATGELLTDTHRMADFGRAVRHPDQTPLTPAACPDQGNLPEPSTGIRAFSPAGQGIYEPWRADMSRDITGVRVTATINNIQAQTQPADLGGALVATGKPGVYRQISLNAATLADPAYSPDGVFYTDPLGRELRQAGDPDAVRQYVRPGLSYTLPATVVCEAAEPMAMLYQCGPTRAPLLSGLYSWGDWALVPMGAN